MKVICHDQSEQSLMLAHLVVAEVLHLALEHGLPPVADRHVLDN